jgi:hypothetical protein
MKDNDNLNAISVEVKLSEHKIIVVSNELFERYKAEIISFDDGDNGSIFGLTAASAKQNIILCEGSLVISETMQDSLIEQLKK